MKTFQDLMQTIQIQEILNSENTDFKLLNPGGFDDNFIVYLSNRINKVLKELYPLELLGEDIEYSKIIFESILTKEFIKLMSNVQFTKLITSSQMFDLNTIDEINSSSDNVVGYSGYSLENQEGQYMKNSANNKSSGANRLQSLEYIRTWTLKWLEDFKSLVRFNLCRIIY